jgi:DNA-binding beta-propeller fold protein YncE
MRSLRWISGPPALALLAAFGQTGCGPRSQPQPPPAGLAYAVTSATYLVGVAITPNRPANTGGAANAYAALPPLPPGLNLDPATGVITGTPTAAAATTTYLITASNGGGSTGTSLVLTVAPAAPNSQALPNLGQQLTPLAAPNARFAPLNPNLANNPALLAEGAVTSALSPDGKTLLVLTSGYNLVFDSQTVPAVIPAESNQYVFIFDVSSGVPMQRQALPVSNTFCGLAWDPGGAAFYIAGGADDVVRIATRAPGTGAWLLDASGPLALNHAKGGLGLSVKPCAAGLALSRDGKTLVVANYYNDSITIFSGGLGHWSAGTELDLRPGKALVNPQSGVPGGAYPFWVAVKGTGAGASAYVSSQRDREIDVVSLGAVPAVTARIKLKGQPNKLTLNAAQTRLYVAEDQTDTVDVIDTASNAILETIPALGPGVLLPAALAGYTGANTNGVTLSPDESQLYVSNGNLNCLSVVPLNGSGSGDQVAGLIPTGWYPNAVTFSADGATVYVVNGKSPTGANPGFYFASANATLTSHPNGMASNLYNPQLIKAGFQTFSRPSLAQLPALTAQVAVNNRFASTVSAQDAAVLAAVRKGVQHVIFIIKENRTYDQVLGDLEVGNGDPDLAQFGQALTPNQHQLARSFVTLDNFYAAAETSTDGWPWTVSGRAPDYIQKLFPVLYAYPMRGLSLDSEGNNRNINVGLATLAERMSANPLLAALKAKGLPIDADLLPGQTNVAAPDGPGNEINTGYLWDQALRAKLSVRNYGFFMDTLRYGGAIPNDPVNSLAAYHTPFASGTIVAFPTSVSLTPHTDLYFRGFDNACPDYYRYTEWARDFDARESGPGLPALSLVRFMHDHTGNFGPNGFPATTIQASDGLDTPEAQIADNDYAVGLLIEKIAKSRYKDNTLIFVIEDDSQDGPDHVDSHRTIALVAGAYVKRQALVSSAYNTVDFLRTIEEVLGLAPMNLNDALARPMAELFTTTPAPWSFTAVPSPILYSSTLPLPPAPAGMAALRPRRSSRYWARATRGIDFSIEDNFNFANYNRILWKGLMGDRPYPAVPSGKDLRQDREQLLARRLAKTAGAAAGNIQ